MKSNIAIVLSVFFIKVSAREFNSSQLENKIIGGRPVKPKHFTSAVSLRYEKRYDCGGCIISLSHVLSAAHCLILQKEDTGEILDKISVYAGSINRKIGGREYFPKHIETHPRYNYGTMGTPFDIGLVTLNEDFTVSEHLSVAILPEDDGTPCPKTDGIVVGWGLDETNVSPKVMNSLRVRVMQDINCETFINNFDKINQFCAFYMGSFFDRSAIDGDCGDPIFLDNDQPSEDRIIGVNSYGTTGFPIIFSRVSKFLAYIDEAKERARNVPKRCVVQNSNDVEHST